MERRVIIDFRGGVSASCKKCRLMDLPRSELQEMQDLHKKQGYQGNK